MMNDKELDEIKKHYKPPFRYDKEGQMIWGKGLNRALDVRGWGGLKYADEPHKIQDDFGQLVADLLNEKLGEGE